MLDMFDLSGKVAVVTGGNRGIGLGIARGLARAGADLAIWSRDEDRNREAAEELRALGARVGTWSCDVASEPEVRRCTDETVEHFGRIDVSFANAGYGSAHDPLRMTLEQWRRLLAVNLDGAFLTLRDAARHMRERGGGGKLIAVSSISALFGTPKQPHYAAGKAGLDALVRSLAVELARHDIQVNSIQPGWIETEATRPAQDHAALNDAILRRTPARRWGRPADLEGIAVYLASRASDYHTGDSIRIDGGYSVF
ncbi:MAG TPA: SDR family oxidoreductase [Deltaproteobacteria bacterium]|nr:SDR family oxidoreductase [Deltaproteobacteria bacterium]